MKATQAHSPIEFWFDFASGYAYFAALEIEALAERHGRSVLWRPFTLGAAFKVTGAQGLSHTPLKGEYARHDWQRLARLKGVVFKLPARHPKVGLPAIRAFYHIERTDPNAAARLAKHIITGYFQDDLDTDDHVAIAQRASLLSLDRDMMLAGMTDSEVKAIARRYGEAAVARGVFVSPWSNNGSPMVRIRSTLIRNPSRGRCLQYRGYARDRRLEEWGSMVTLRR